MSCRIRTRCSSAAVAGTSAGSCASRPRAPTRGAAPPPKRARSPPPPRPRPPSPRRAPRSAAVREGLLRERARAAAHYDEPERSQFLALKLEGILDAPLNLCVTCDPTRGGPHVLGRSAMRETDVYSTCCAVENFWLAARAEGIGVGWVSIVQPDELRRILEIPEPVIAVAYLCVGYVSDFSDTPDPARPGWRH